MTVTAASGSQASVLVGHNGNGILNAFDGSSISVGSEVGNVFTANGSVYVGREVGSTGLLTLSSGSVINAGFVGVGVSAAGTGNTIGTPGGVGTLALDGGTVNTGRFELGAGSLLIGNGDIDAVDDVLIAGEVSPGYSPGRIRIRCNIVILPGGRIVLEISGSGSDFATGYEIDQLIIGEAATFDLGSADIVFSFLGDTNPNVVSAIGGLNLDYYLRAGSEDPDAPLDDPTLALSALFKTGQGWSDVIDTQQVSAVSERYDVTSFSYSGGGRFELTAVPVPEPSTWGLMFAGLFAVGAMARRRKAQAAQA